MARYTTSTLSVSLASSCRRADSEEAKSSHRCSGDRPAVVKGGGGDKGDVVSGGVIKGMW